MSHKLLNTPYRVIILSLVLLIMAFVGLAIAPHASAIECPPGGCCSCKPTPEPVVKAVPVVTDDICVTSKTRVAIMKNRKGLAIFSDFVESNPNGMLITEIPFSAIRSVTDEEKAAGKVVWLASKDSEYAQGWHVELYWYNGHYGVVVTGNGFSDDTGATCGNF